jgi:hypothetical protein
LDDHGTYGEYAAIKMMEQIAGCTGRLLLLVCQGVPLLRTSSDCH